MKKLNIQIIFIGSLLFLLLGCDSVKKGLSLKKQANNDEFLVKKKKPLTLPPNYNDLPTPEISTETNQENGDKIDFKNIFKEKNKITKNQEIDSTQGSSLEKSIIKIINVN